MKQFVFTLVPSVQLCEKNGSFFLLSKFPLRLLRINRELYLILTELGKGSNIEEVIDRHKIKNISQVIELLITLVARGYLHLRITGNPAEYPRVSIIVPVRDQSEKLKECVKSLQELSYPRDKYEIIVVDDGSVIPVKQEIMDANIRIIRFDRSRGPAAARNSGFLHSSGEILGFLDADCCADKNWLNELIPFFQIMTIGVIGGFVDSYYNIKFLERYEKVNSPLNLGNNFIFQIENASTFYVPSCNMLVSRQAFTAIGGFNEELQVGEDVDLCWRLRDKGYLTIYAPVGKVSHKHRSKLSQMMKRRFDYGTSESILYNLHKNRKKNLIFPIWSGLALITMLISILLLNPLPLSCLPLFLALDFWFKTKALTVKITLISFLVVFRSWIALGYSLSFHLLRYYMLLLILAGIFYYPVWILGLIIFVFCSITDYTVKKPALFYPVFGFYYLVEHLAYQMGVFWGCIKRLKFRSYLVSLCIRRH